MDRNDHLGSPDHGNSYSNDGFSDGFTVRKRLLGSGAQADAALQRV